MTCFITLNSSLAILIKIANQSNMNTTNEIRCSTSRITGNRTLSQSDNGLLGNVAVQSTCPLCGSQTKTLGTVAISTASSSSGKKRKINRLTQDEEFESLSDFQNKLFAEMTDDELFEWSGISRELDDVFNNDRFEGQSLDLLDTSAEVIHFIDYANIVVNGIHEIYTIIYSDCIKSVKIYKVYTKLNTLYLICTGRTLATDAYTNMCDSLLSEYIKKWLYDTNSSSSSSECSLRENVFDDLISASHLSQESDDPVERNRAYMRNLFSGEALVDTARTLNDKSKDLLALTESDFGQKLLTFCSLVVCVPFINKMGITPQLFNYSEASEFFLRKSYSQKGVAVPILLLEASTSVFLKLTEVMTLGISALYVSSDDHNTLEREFQWLRRNRTNFSCCTEVLNEKGEVDPFTLDGYAHRCEEALTLLARIIPALKKHPYALVRAEKQKANIEDWQNDCYAELRANITRVQPIGLMFVGQPGVGKSAIQDISLQVLHDSDNVSGRFEIPYSPNLVYYYNPNDNFYSGFSSSHTSIVMDDLAQKQADIMKALGGDDIMDLIRVVNSQPFSPEQAELHKKGKTPMRCRYVIGTTNTESLHAQYIFSNPAAIYRRFIFVRCEVKTQYRDEFGAGLRGDPNDVSNTDLWDFTIIKHFPIGDTTIMRYFDPVTTKRTGKMTWVSDPIPRTKCGISDYTNFLRNYANVHWTQQAKATTIQKILEVDAKCTCGMKHSLCKGQCWEAQGLFSTVYSVYSWYNNAWTLSSYMAFSFLFAFAPTWSIAIWSSVIFSLMRRTLNPSSFFANFGDAVASTWLLIVIIPLLSCNSILEKVWPSKVDDPSTRPRFCVMAAMKLVPYLPRENTLRNFVKMPKTYSFNNKRLFRQRWLNVLTSEYYIDWLEAKAIEPARAYDYFRKNILCDYRFQSCIWFILAVKVALRIMKTSGRFGGQASLSKMPIPDDVEIVNRSSWVKENHIGEYPAKGRTIREYQLNAQVMLNTVLLQFKHDKGISTTNGFIVMSNLIVTPAHIINDTKVDAVIVKRLTKSGAYSIVEFKIDASNMWVDKGRDLLFIKSNRLDPGRYLYDYLLSKKETVHINGSGLMNYVDPESGEHKFIKCSRVCPNLSIPSYGFRGQEVNATRTLYVYMDEPTRVGMCGAPMIVTQGVEKYIVGIHCAGTSNKAKFHGLSAQLFKEDVDAALSFLGHYPLINDADDDIAFSMNAEAMTIKSVHPKCITNELKGEYHVIGGSALPRARPSTQVKHTPFSTDVVDYYALHTEFNKILHTSPMRCDPKQAALVAMRPAVTNSNFYPTEIEFAVNCLSHDIISKLTDKQFERMKPVPWSVAVNGRDGIPYVDRMNMKTSAGYGHTGPKKRFFSLVNSTPEHQVNYEMTPELVEEVMYIVKQYDKGQEANPVFKCSFKDEPITFAKEEANKVRVFSGSPIAFSLVARKYYLPFIRECVGQGRLNFEMAIGANAHGEDWNNIYKHVIKHGEHRCFAGDFKAFDKQMSPELILAAFNVIMNIYAHAGWQEDDLKYARGVAVDTAFPTTDLFGTIVQLYGSNPSGHILTTPINSLVNSLYFRMAVARIFVNNGYTVGMDFPTMDKYVNMTNFNDIVSLVTYGDDNCGSISKKYPFISHTSIQAALAEAGITYTMDQKDAKSVEFVHVNNISFLKRKFVIDNELNTVLAPLLEESLFKSLTVWTTSRSICEKEQMAAVLSSINREYYFYGKTIFNSRHQFFLSLVLKYGLGDYIPGGTLETYEELVESINHKN